MRRVLRRARRRAGQAAVLIAMSMFSLVIFLALATNMGILVNDRIRIQNAVDLGAYAAAYKEAQQLNRLVQLNSQIVDTVDQCRQILTSVSGWTGYECLCVNRSYAAEAVIDACKAILMAQETQFALEAAWTSSVSPALDVGRSTIDANVSGLGNSSYFFETNALSATFPGNYNVELPGGAGGVPAIANYEIVKDTILNYPVFMMCPTPSGGCVPVGPVPSPNYPVDSWYVKDDQGPDVWVMASASGTMETRYIDIDNGGGGRGYFGGTSDGGGSDRMVAVGVAKPFEGSIGPPNNSSSVIRSGNFPIGPYYTESSTQFTDQTLIEEYRARIAGIREWQNANGADYDPESALSIESRDDLYYYASRFRH